jgi:hypothetical protein
MIRIIRPSRWRRYRRVASTRREDKTMLYGMGAASVALGLALSTQSVHAQSDMPAMDSSAHHAAMTAPQAGATPTLPGQDAFGAIQEVLHILEADPGTDWSKVNIDALREHLIDMNEVTLHANVAKTVVDGGLRIEVTGEGRTLPAIQRMVSAQAHEINGENGWKTNVEPLSDGVVLTVTAGDPKQAMKIRALGFIGIMAQGAHHQRHHLAIARGEFTP